MTACFTAAEFARLNAIDDRLKRQLTFVALLDRKLARTTIVERPIIVGGGAVEVYTSGGYASQDIDVVLLDRRPAEEILAASGFRKTGRYWSRSDLDLLIEFPGSALTYGPAAYDRVTTIDLGEELSAAVIGVEDILVGRVYSGVSERRANDLKWAIEMAILQRDRIDWPAALALARDNGPETLAEVERIRALAADEP